MIEAIRSYVARHREIVVLALVLGALWDQSYNGRVRLVDHARQQCRHASRDLARLANVIRLDAEGNLAVSEDKRQPMRTRRVRYIEYQGELRNLLAIDRDIDRSVALSYLNDSGRDYVRLLGARAYDCDRAHSAASPFQFFG